MENSIQIPLNLPYVRLLEISQTEKGEWLIKVESRVNSTKCRKCGEEIKQLHGYDKAIRLRHLPLFEVPVYIELRPKRYRCQKCEGGPTTTQGLSWYEQRSPNTKAYEKWLLKMLINSTVTDVARKLQVKEGVVNGVLNRNLECQVDWEKIERLPVIGIDEIALRKGHGNYVTLITAPMETGIAILGVLKDRKQETVVDFLKTIPAHIRETIECVCSDMYLGFVNAVRAELPQSRVIVDRFHVAKAYRNCADKVRRKEMKRLRQDLSKPEYQELKGAMWAFRRSLEELGDKDGPLLARLFELAPRMERAYELREELTEIFEGTYTTATAKNALKNWCQKVKDSGVAAEFDGFLTTAANWLEEITNYFAEGWSSGFVEGFNNRVKILKRRCYGIFDTGRLFQRLSLDVNGYRRLGIP